MWIDYLLKNITSRVPWHFGYHHFLFKVLVVIFNTFHFACKLFIDCVTSLTHLFNKFRPACWSFFLPLYKPFILQEVKSRLTSTWHAYTWHFAVRIKRWLRISFSAFAACKKTELWVAGMVICLERGADLHMVWYGMVNVDLYSAIITKVSNAAQLMPLPLTVSCFSKIQIGFTFLEPAYPGSPGKRAVKRVCVSVCVCSVLWHCWLGVRKSNRHVKIEWWRGVVICLEQGADCLHLVQLLPLLSQNPIIW